MTDRIISKTNNIYWWNRLIDSIEKTIVTPLVTALLSILHYWNERNIKKQLKVIEDEGKKIVTEVNDSFDDTIDPKFDGKLVHITGFVKRSNDDEISDDEFDEISDDEFDEISDDEFGLVNIPGIIKLQRNVEMYQWIESRQESSDEEEEEERDEEEELTNTSSTLCGPKTTETTTYTYTLGWVPIVVDSHKFCSDGKQQYKNPSTIPFEFKRWTSSHIMLGSYNLSSSNEVVQKMNTWYVPFKDYQYSVDSIPSTTKELVRPLPIHVYPNDDEDKRYGYYIGIDPTTPQLGDIRITYSVVLEEIMVSIIGQQQSDSESITTYNGKSGGSILLVQQGILDTNTMFQNRIDELTNGLKISQTLQSTAEDFIRTRYGRRFLIFWISMAVICLVVFLALFIWLATQYWFAVFLIIMGQNQIKSTSLHVRICYILFVLFWISKGILLYHNTQQQVAGDDPTKLLVEE